MANQHFRRYDPSSLHAVLAASGFEVEVVRFFFFWTVAPLLARRWLAPADASGQGGGSGRLCGSHTPAPINWALTMLSRGEHALGRLVRWPLGTSLLAIARRSTERV